MHNDRPNTSITQKAQIRPQNKVGCIFAIRSLTYAGNPFTSSFITLAGLMLKADSRSRTGLLCDTIAMPGEELVMYRIALLASPFFLFDPACNAVTQSFILSKVASLHLFPFDLVRVLPCARRMYF